MRWHPNFFNCSTNSVTLPVYFILSRLDEFKGRAKLLHQMPNPASACTLRVDPRSIRPLLTQLPSQARSFLYSMHTVPYLRSVSPFEFTLTCGHKFLGLNSTGLLSHGGSDVSAPSAVCCNTCYLESCCLPLAAGNNVAVSLCSCGVCLS
ncbi:hypothetical protein B0H13DRAFT_2062531 [Mycena leptocephala]|nr:hypothetical protein B0H13DRAFT_2062531 [Mycena leptocephala]